MTITLLFFAAVRELVGESQRTLALPEGVRTVRELADHLPTLFPALRGRLQAVRWARNEELVALDAALENGDVVALIPPVAGG